MVTRSLLVFLPLTCSLSPRFRFHWKVLIVCHPGNIKFPKTDSRLKPVLPVAIVFDSMHTSKAKVGPFVCNFLEKEAESKQYKFPLDSEGDDEIRLEEPTQSASEPSVGVSLSDQVPPSEIPPPIRARSSKQKTDIFHSKSLPFIAPVKIPRQTNFTDCGVFLLAYVEAFMANPPPVASDKAALEKHLEATMIIEGDFIDRKRREIADTIYRLGGKTAEEIHLIEQKAGILTAAVAPNPPGESPAAATGDSVDDGIYLAGTKPPTTPVRRSTRQTKLALRNVHSVPEVDDPSDGDFQLGREGDKGGRKRAVQLYEADEMSMPVIVVDSGGSQTNVEAVIGVTRNDSMDDSPFGDFAPPQKAAEIEASPAVAPAPAGFHPVWTQPPVHVPPFPDPMPTQPKPTASHTQLVALSEQSGALAEVAPKLNPSALEPAPLVEKASKRDVDVEPIPVDDEVDEPISKRSRSARSQASLPTCATVSPSAAQRPPEPIDTYASALEAASGNKRPVAARDVGRKGPGKPEQEIVPDDSQPPSDEDSDVSGEVAIPAPKSAKRSGKRPRSRNGATVKRHPKEGAEEEEVQIEEDVPDDKSGEEPKHVSGGTQKPKKRKRETDSRQLEMGPASFSLEKPRVPPPTRASTQEPVPKRAMTNSSRQRQDKAAPTKNTLQFVDDALTKGAGSKADQEKSSAHVLDASAEAISISDSQSQIQSQIECDAVFAKQILWEDRPRRVHPPRAK